MPADSHAPAREASAGPVREAYLRCLLAADVPGARRVTDDAVAGGLPVRDVYLGVLQPTPYEVGRLWSQAEISVAQEHLATAATQAAMARLADRLAEAAAPRPRRGVAVVACVSDELHAVGGRMVADCAELRALDPPPFVIVGGQAFAGSRERALRTGADAFAEDAGAAVGALRERFG